jgi:hypothetical protein
MFSYWVSFLAYLNLFGIKDCCFVVIVVVLSLSQTCVVFLSKRSYDMEEASKFLLLCVRHSFSCFISECYLLSYFTYLTSYCEKQQVCASLISIYNFRFYLLQGNGRW